MKLMCTRLKALGVVIALLPSISCTADVTKRTSEHKSACSTTKNLIGPLQDFLSSEMATLLSHSPEQLPYSVPAELLEDLRSLVACSTRLTELELKDYTAVDRERCDPLPISITLKGLEGSLKAVAECETADCTMEKLSLEKQVMKHQTERLRQLANKCGDI